MVNSSEIKIKRYLRGILFYENIGTHSYVGRMRDFLLTIRLIRIKCRDYNGKWPPTSQKLSNLLCMHPCFVLHKPITLDNVASETSSNSSAYAWLPDDTPDIRPNIFSGLGLCTSRASNHHHHRPSLFSSPNFHFLASHTFPKESPPK